MKTRIAPLSFPTAVVLFATLSGNAAHAAAPDAVDACIELFVAGHLADHQGRITINKEMDIATPAVRRTSTQVVRVAAATKSGKALASATCVVNERGMVLSMRPGASRAAMLAQKARKEIDAAKRGDAS